MTNVELALNTLAEAATTELSKEINPTTYRENVTVAEKVAELQRLPVSSWNSSLEGLLYLIPIHQP